jgi:hypothetical protein
MVEEYVEQDTRVIIIIIYLSSVDPYIGSKNKPVDIEHVPKY